MNSRSWQLLLLAAFGVGSLLIDSTAMRAATHPCFGTYTVSSSCDYAGGIDSGSPKGDTGSWCHPNTSGACQLWTAGDACHRWSYVPPEEGDDCARTCAGSYSETYQECVSTTITRTLIDQTATPSCLPGSSLCIATCTDWVSTTNASVSASWVSFSTTDCNPNPYE